MTDTKILGILGGGQLGRMSALAAARLGIPVIIFCPEVDCPASYVVRETIYASYDDLTALEKFSEKVDFISYEFENIPVETIDYLEKLKPGSVRPGRQLLDVSQDRIREKSYLNSLGIETAQWAAFEGLEALEKTLHSWAAKAFVAKTVRFGYDGKGQIFCSAQGIANNPDFQDFLMRHDGQALIIEEAVDFSDEVSVIIARDINGKTALYGPMLNEHKHHILHRTTVPAPFPPALASNAFSMAEKLAEGVGLVGVLTLELFVTKDGRLLANEIAPRTHNSGHWTIDACSVSQFEQHVRTVCGLPVGSSARHSDAEMLNLIGDDILKTPDYMAQENACLHLYGKHEARAGRKMGHVTFIKPLSD
ncbi:MAG: 5-(carboxyamino)imidazole ribonucleotide synthase [Alphaproteobacteria bacterium]|nr:5-(carboxyamino)imidazole ribonucleotide synthase [Alphaproteobacteria bacterium]